MPEWTAWRAPHIVYDECDLCGEDGYCLKFGDNEGYSTEKVCETCMRKALKLIKKEKE